MQTHDCTDDADPQFHHIEKSQEVDFRMRRDIGPVMEDRVSVALSRLVIHNRKCEKVQNQGED